MNNPLSDDIKFAMNAAVTTVYLIVVLVCLEIAGVARAFFKKVKKKRGTRPASSFKNLLSAVTRPFGLAKNLDDKKGLHFKPITTSKRLIER